MSHKSRNHWLPLLCPVATVCTPPEPEKRPTKCRAVLVISPNGEQRQYKSIADAAADIKIISSRTIARAARSGKTLKYGEGIGYRAQFVE